MPVAVNKEVTVLLYFDAVARSMVHTRWCDAAKTAEMF